MIQKTQYKTPRELCGEILPFAEGECGKLTKRPWNRFKPDLTSWWLVPSTDIPHFKHAKYYFKWGDKQHTSLLAGLYIEKGLDEKLAIAYSSKKARNFIMTPDWAWYSFLESLKKKQAFETLKNNCPPLLEIQFIINGGYVTEPTAFDPYQDKNLMGWDEYAFSWTPKSEEMELISSNRQAYVLKMHHIKTIDDFIQTMTTLSQDEWLWLNTFIALKIDIVDNTESTWPANQIWNDFLKHLSFQ